jgi:hypothetical protein
MGVQTTAKIILVPIESIKENPANPRIIKDEKFRKLVDSIQNFPEMMELRPIIIDENNTVLGGNMRLKALKELGIKEAPVIYAKDLTEVQKKEFIIKDNLPFGEWDWEMIATEWDAATIEEWGLDLPGFDVNIDEMGDDFSLPDGGKGTLQQITFILADAQAEQIKNAIEEIKQTEEYKYCETFGNENTNGNALYLIVMQWAEQRK